MYRCRCSQKLAHSQMFISWIGSIIFAFPPLFGLGSYVYHRDMSTCALDHRHYTDNDTLVYLLIIAFFITAITMLYIRAFLFLRKKRKMFPGQGLRPLQSSDWTFNNVRPYLIGQNIHRVTTYPMGFFSQSPFEDNDFHHNRLKAKTLTFVFMLITILYVVCLSPYLLICMWATLSYDVPYQLKTISSLIRYLYLILFPSVRVFLIPQMRQSLRILLPKIRREKSVG